MAGWSLYVADGHPTYVYNYFGRELTTLRAEAELAPGPVEVGVHFDYDGGGLGQGGTAVLLVGGSALVPIQIVVTILLLRPRRARRWRGWPA